MTTKLITSVAAGALVLSAAFAPLAYAQESVQPETGTTPADTDTATTPSTTMTTDTVVDAAAGEKYITAQSETQISANTYIGQAVYSGADENIGKISDLIIDKDGGVAAAVVGVGGFLGIGEKWVAVPFDTVSISQIPDSSDVKLTTTETAESLKAAPEFKTRAQQVAERNAAAPVDATGTTGTAPAPAPVE